MMMIKSLSAFLMLALLTIQVNATVYGITFGLGGDNTMSLVQTVSISSAGAFSPIATNLVYVGDAATYDGISAFDTTKGVFYYTTDFEASFVYSVDVSQKALGPPISISSIAVSEIVVDESGEQLLVTGIYANDTYLIVSVPAQGPASVVFNFSEVGVKYPFDAALDEKNGIYYFVYLSGANALELGQFELKTPQSFKSSKYPCSAGLSPVDIYFDQAKGAIVGYSIKSKTDKYYYHEIVDGKCTETLLSVQGIVTCSAYDPTQSSLYMGVANNTGNYLQTYSVSSKSLSVLPVDSVLTDVGVSYKTL